MITKFLSSSITASVCCIALASSLSGCTITNSDPDPNESSSSIYSSVASDSNTQSSISSSMYSYESDTVKLTRPAANAMVLSPVTISGSARGNWFFEAVIPLEIRASDGTVIQESFTQTSADWMTTDFVPFSTQIDFTVETPTEAFIVVKKSNPSGLPENEAEIQLPVTLLPDSAVPTNPTVQPQALYENKVVYGVSYSNESELAAWQQDCNTRGGEFNECGSQCAPNAQACTTVCAYVCTLSDSDQPANTSSWQTYKNSELGVQFRYPIKATVSPISPIAAHGSGVQVRFRGPTQKDATELFDGYSVSIYTQPNATSVQNFVDSELKSITNIGSVDSAPTSTMLAGRSATTFTATTLGTHTHYVVQNQSGMIFHIATLSPDPNNQGYKTLVQTLLSSVELL